MTLDNTVGAGTTIRLYLPMAEGDAEVPAKIELPVKVGMCGQRERILLVVDNADLRELTAMMLERLGYQV
ncbi:hypothetical protein [Breoghania sp.]|uniref:hypothetical protein n=1 Tax=Breoghania sp. TaxID=2065378 RepID=UPI00261FD09C|nr:hypothetical protein [Breoghania sp.]MDJ0931881.1 hypothetical protein [Breoghania sp.]